MTLPLGARSGQRDTRRKREVVGGRIGKLGALYDVIETWVISLPHSTPRFVTGVHSYSELVRN